jgi:hypothetical protein
MKDGGKELLEMLNYAIYVASTWNYIGYTNALLNSIYKRKFHEKCTLTVYLFHNDEHGFFKTEYLHDLSKFPFNVVSHEISRNDFQEINDARFNEYIKRTRYKIVLETAEQYDAVCLLDADMFFVSEQFIDLFDLVSDTDKLIGCNERFKWNVDNYILNNKPMFKKNDKLYNMICNVPAIFDMKKWRHVFERYVDIAANGRQTKNGDIVGIGDLFCWNLAIKYEKMNNKIVCFPMETMAQVHHTYTNDWTYIIVENDYWYTFAGDRVYSIHGRIAQDNFVAGNVEFYKQTSIKNGMNGYEKNVPKIEAGLKKVQSEWYDLNFNQCLKIADYIDIPQFFDNFKG